MSKIGDGSRRVVAAKGLDLASSVRRIGNRADLIAARQPEEVMKMMIRYMEPERDKFIIVEDRT